MPYNTRRKSLSLPSLGIHLPNASRSHRSPSASKSSTSGSTILDEHPSKKVKRSHDVADSSTSADKSQKVATGRIRNSRGGYEHTPPPSPGDAVDAAMKIDTEGINDDVVVAAIEQLEKTGNKPHLVRELAAVLVKINDTVANSANPAALLSSRLSTYMKRSWTALSPCPIGKELINVHPRKVFYYLTNTPHQPLPENLEDMVAMDEKRLTPSLSSGSVDQDDEDDAMARERSRLSPSPEIDLSSPEFEVEHDTFNARNGSGSHTNQNNGHHRLSHNHRAASPPLEGDEREFTQTASSLRERASEEKASRQSSLAALSMPTSDESHDAQIHAFPGSPMDEDPLTTSISEKSQYGDYLSQGGSNNQEQDLDDAAVATLFGTSPSPSLTSVATSLSSGTTAPSEAELADVPLALPTSDLARSNTATATATEGTSPSSLKRSFDMVETGFPTKSVTDFKRSQTFDFEMVIDSWADLRSPETVEVDELDEMFGDF
ncbi:conserved hypothetical protein [Talaromyces stipitatus ATCC 10500]|uniref:GDS1 winged helix domain-containing protein n=1 Tax=Talaromyces stipitatus (strain ATCC 10500 / CBS 375.48 / QM 6759 / NRRL 1006) TaxID=441959 RepID=B8M6Q7_TALSN|nr:uncharacterized protein TSTA_028100 [Talaromyces stipitatus ATCC 10500]EED19519.1 conserved hypothetical protein [Talaromyces stipitatus ATCC 10500]